MFYGQQLITVKTEFMHRWELSFLSVLFMGNTKLGIVVGTWKDGTIVRRKLGEGLACVKVVGQQEYHGMLLWS